MVVKVKRKKSKNQSYSSKVKGRKVMALEKVKKSVIKDKKNKVAAKKKVALLSASKVGKRKMQKQKSNLLKSSGGKQKIVKKPIAKVKARITKPKKAVHKKVVHKKVVKSILKTKQKKKGQQGAMLRIEKIINNIGIEGIEPYIPKEKENYMSIGMQNHFRKILLAWKQKLMAEADRTLQHMQDESTNFPDPSDRATQEEEFSLELRARDRERKLIKKIDDALVMLEEGNYGYCEGCGEEIGLRRLEARPTATLCIDCKTLDEIREKQQGS